LFIQMDLANIFRHRNVIFNNLWKTENALIIQCSPAPSATDPAHWTFCSARTTSCRSPVIVPYFRKMPLRVCDDQNVLEQEQAKTRALANLATTTKVANCAAYRKFAASCLSTILGNTDSSTFDPRRALFYAVKCCRGIQLSSVPSVSNKCESCPASRPQSRRQCTA